MNRSDFFRRLGLAVAALFAPKVVKGMWLEPAPTNNQLWTDGRSVIKNCTFEGPKAEGYHSVWGPSSIAMIPYYDDPTVGARGAPGGRIELFFGLSGKSIGTFGSPLVLNGDLHMKAAGKYVTVSRLPQFKPSGF